MTRLKKSKSLLSVVIGISVASCAFATVTPKKPLTGKVSFGFTSNTGNTRDNNVIGGLELTHKYKKWESKGSVTGQVKSDKDGETAHNYTASGETEYSFLPRHFGFGRVNYKYDKFAAYLYTVTAIGGYGWKLVDRDKVNLTLKIGPGARRMKQSSNNKTESDVIFYYGGLFEWQLTKTAKFSQTLTFEDGKNNNYMESKTALTTTIIGNLALEASFLVKHNSKIPSGSKNEYKTDTTTQLALVYSF